MTDSFIAKRLMNSIIKGFSVIDDGDVGLVIEYIGEQASGTVTVAADGNLTFKHGALAAEVNDTSIGGSADSGATIDVSEAGEDTFGEVVDLINGSANWRARLVDVLRSDTSTDTLLLASAAQAKLPYGLRAYKDTSVALNLSVALRKADYPNEDFVEDNAGRVVAETLELGKWSEVLKIISTNTFGSGTSKIQVFKVNRLSGASTKIYERSGAATTVEQEADLSDGNGRGLATGPDEYLLARIVGSAAMTGQFQVNGKVI